MESLLPIMKAPIVNLNAIDSIIKNNVDKEQNKYHIAELDSKFSHHYYSNRIICDHNTFLAMYSENYIKSIIQICPQ